MKTPFGTTSDLIRRSNLRTKWVKVAHECELVHIIYCGRLGSHCNASIDNKIIFKKEHWEGKECPVCKSVLYKRLTPIGDMEENEFKYYQGENG
jgi:hypothetical protein